MNKIIKLICFCIFFLSEINPVTIVYNLKTRRIFDISIADILSKEKKSVFVTSFIPIVSKRDRHIVEEELNADIFERSLLGGSLLNFRYIVKNWWAEATTAIANETVKARGTSNFKASRTGFDDIILSAGFNKHFSKAAQFVLYGLVGFPTKFEVNLNERYNTLLGTRFYSLGFGSEFSFSPISELKKSLTGIIQIRFLHFFDRKLEPILPKTAKIKPGNVTDLLLTIQYRKKTKILELGYNPTFFTNQAVILENEKIEGPNFIRHSAYLSLSRFIANSIFKVPLLVGIGTSFANANRFDSKTISAWLNLSFVF